MIAEETLALFAGRAPNDNARSFLLGLRMHGAAAGLDRPHRLAHLVAQVLHESGRFKFDRELWGRTPTAAQARYRHVRYENPAAADISRGGRSPPGSRRPLRRYGDHKLGAA